MACHKNTFFAHKVWFNLKASLINKDDNRQMLKIFQLLSEIEILIEKSDELLYFANSRQLLRMITKCDLSNLLDEDLSTIVA